MLHGETIHSALPQDIPWWQPDFAIFFGVLYTVLLFLLCGLIWVGIRTVWDLYRENCPGQACFDAKTWRKFLPFSKA
ncbi:MAG: hypothetical protein PUB69_05370 [Desulfovibrionaceae bacterium]|nr:hypothetical protein [Desulfovibrionaceae bacterium]